MPPACAHKGRIPRDRRRRPREDRREDVGVSGDFPVQRATGRTLQEIARVGRVGEDPREDVGVGVVECGLICDYRPK